MASGHGLVVRPALVAVSSADGSSANHPILTWALCLADFGLEGYGAPTNDRVRSSAQPESAGPTSVTSSNRSLPAIDYQGSWLGLKRP